MLIPPTKPKKFYESLLPTNYQERRNPLNRFPSSRIESQRTMEGCLSLNFNRWAMKICHIYDFESTQQNFVSRLSRECFCSHHRSYSCPKSERWGNKYLLVTSCGRQKPSEGECQSQRLHTAQICHSQSDLGNYIKDTWFLSLLKVSGSTTNILYEVPWMIIWT